MNTQAVIIPKTATMAEIYIQQGHLHKARHIYVDLLTQQPGHRLYQQRLDWLKNQLGDACMVTSDVMMDKNKQLIEKLERWLNKVKTRRTH